MLILLIFWPPTSCACLGLMKGPRLKATATKWKMRASRTKRAESSCESTWHVEVYSSSSTSSPETTNPSRCRTHRTFSCSNNGTRRVLGSSARKQHIVATNCHTGPINKTMSDVSQDLSNWCGNDHRALPLNLPGTPKS